MGWILNIVGAGAQAASSIRQGKEDEATAKINQQLADYQAQDATQRGAIEEGRFRRQLAQFVGRQRNEIGSRNVELRGSALRLLEDSAQLGEEDALTIRNDAARTAWGYKNQANEAARFGAQSKLNSYGRAGGSLLTGAAQSYGQWRESRGY